MDSAVNFLGISIVGQSSSRGDNGIYVVSFLIYWKYFIQLLILNCHNLCANYS